MHACTLLPQLPCALNSDAPSPFPMQVPGNLPKTPPRAENERLGGSGPLPHKAAHARPE